MSEFRARAVTAMRFVALIFWYLLSPGAHAECRVGKVAEMPITEWHNHIYVPVTVNDTPGMFMLDTGASLSMLESDFAARAGVAWDKSQPRMVLEGVGGKQTGIVLAGRIRMLEFGGLKIPDREMPMSELLIKQPNGQKVDGLLGAEMLNLLDLELDFQTGTARFWRLFGCSEITPLHWSGDYASIPLRRQASKHVQIPIWLDGAVIQAVLDTGAGGLVIDRETALQAGATLDQLAHDPVLRGMGVGGAAGGRRHVFKMLLVGKDIYHDVPVFVTDTSDEDGHLHALIGMASLNNHRVWFSYGTETLFLQSLAGARK
jgi:predicted aspartyl protease